MNYRILLLAMLFSTVGASCLQAQEMYARGSFNEWGTWHKMVLTDTAAQIWEAKSVYLTNDTLEMKFANTGDWSGDDWGGGSALSDSLELTTGGGPNSKFYVADAGYYDLVFDQANLTYTFTLTPFSANHPLMYARGSFNGWGTEHRMYLIANHQWKTTVRLDAIGYQMKFANHPDWAGDDWGNATGLTGTALTTTGGGPDMNFVITDAGDYEILFNDSSLVYSIGPVTNATAVERSQLLQTLRVYPNPAAGWVVAGFDLKRSQEVRIELVDLQGRRLADQAMILSAGVQSVRIDLSAIPAGTYLLRVGDLSRMICLK